MIRIILMLTFFSALFDNEPDEIKGKHVFYLHGMIVEIQGINAVSELFGKYEYLKIIEALNDDGVTVHSEVRTNGTDFIAFCEKTSKEINSLINSGVHPDSITVIGASIGAVMAMYISDMNVNPIKYVFLAGNNNRREETNEWNFHGRILGIYEKSDSVAGKNYQYWIDKSTNAVEFEQVELTTGLDHGFIYNPIKEWMDPTKKWIDK